MMRRSLALGGSSIAHCTFWYEPTMAVEALVHRSFLMFFDDADEVFHSISLPLTCSHCGPTRSVLCAAHEFWTIDARKPCEPGRSERCVLLCRRPAVPAVSSVDPVAMR